MSWAHGTRVLRVEKQGILPGANDWQKNIIVSL